MTAERGRRRPPEFGEVKRTWFPAVESLVLYLYTAQQVSRTERVR